MDGPEQERLDSSTTLTCRDRLRHYRFFDWIVTIFLCICSFLMHFVPPKPHQVLENDPALDFEFKDSQVPDWLLILLSGVFPLIVVPIISLLWRSVKYDAIHSTLGLLQSFAITQFFVDFVKKMAGRPRPNFYALCGKDYVFTHECSQSKYAQEAFQSFPSGHSSMSFSTLFYLTLLLLGKFALQRNSDRIWRLVVACMPTLLATWIAVTRVQDNWHNFSDIFAGSAIGAFFAFACYWINYASIVSSEAGNPLYSYNVQQQLNPPAHGQEEVLLNTESSVV